MDALEARMDAVEARMDGLEGRMDGLEARMDGSEARMDAMEKRNEEQHKVLFRRFDQLDGHLKKFASIVNDVAAYAEEMDSVRGRLDVIESKQGISYPSE